jgi:hypothetical protein
VLAGVAVRGRPVFAGGHRRRSGRVEQVAVEVARARATLGPGSTLFAEGEQLLDGLGAGRACKRPIHN